MPQIRATTVTLSEDLYGKGERAALAQGRSVDGVTQEALSGYIKHLQWERLKAYGREKAKERGIGPDDVEQLIEESRQEHGR